MSVPDTGNFSLQDVTTEIGGGVTSLSACFSAAYSSGFNVTYEGSKDRLSNFRDYTHNCVSVTGFTFYPTATTSGSACGPVGGASTFYHDGAGSRPANADIIYDDASGCAVFNGGGNWFSDYNGSTRRKFTVSASGVVGSLTNC